MKYIELIISFVSFKKRSNPRYKFLKKVDLNQNLPIWQVVEFDEYASTRTKCIGNKIENVGLLFTTNYIKILNIKNKVINATLVISTNNFDSYKNNVNFDDYDIVILVENIGLDLGAHKTALHALKNNYKKHQQIIVSNSSFVPHLKFRLLDILKISSNTNLLCGVSYSFGPRYYIIKKYHLQSFFLTSNLSYIYKIFDKLSINNNNKYHVIRNGELSITSLAYKFGLITLCYDGECFFLLDHQTYSFKFYDHRLSSN